MLKKYGVVSASLIATLATIWVLVRREQYAAKERLVSICSALTRACSRKLFETTARETGLAYMPLDNRKSLHDSFAEQWDNTIFQNNATDNELRGW